MLNRIGLVERSECSFCNVNVETLIHFFSECQYVDRLWVEVREWININTGLEITFTTENKLFGFGGINNSALNCITMLVRYEIYVCKIRKIIPRFDLCKYSIREYYDREKFIARNNHKLQVFQKKWCLFRHLFS